MTNVMVSIRIISMIHNNNDGNTINNVSIYEVLYIQLIKPAQRRYRVKILFRIIYINYLERAYMIKVYDS